MVRRFIFRNFALAAVALAGITLASCSSAAGPSSQSIEGTWSGVLTATYYCEATPGLVELSIVGDSVTVTGGTGLPIDLTGTMSEQAPGRYTVAFNNEGVQPGLLIFDQDAQYATFVSDDSPVTGDREGYVGLVQKAPLQAVSYTEADLVGNWSGVAARVDAGYSVTESYEITATVTEPEGLALSGQDGDGSFSAAAVGIVLENDYQQNPYPGLYVSGWGSVNQVIWPELGQNGAYDALYALSYDKSVLAVGFLTDVCSQQIFNNLPAQKFALMMRQ